MSINVFTFSGNCGKDMELRSTPNGTMIGTVGVPCSSGWGDKQKTTWIQCKVFGDRAEKIAPYLTRGKAVTVTGRFELDEWEKDGVNHSRPVCIIQDIEWATPSQQANSAAQKTNSPTAGSANNAPQEDQGFADFDDDIPF